MLGTGGLRQPPDFLFSLSLSPPSARRAKSQWSVHPEWLFQPSHQDAGAELKQREKKKGREAGGGKKMNRVFV